MLTYFLDQKWFVRSFVNPLEDKTLYDVWAGSSIMNSSCYPIILNCGKQTANKIVEDHNLVLKGL